MPAEGHRVLLRCITYTSTKERLGEGRTLALIPRAMSDWCRKDWCCLNHPKGKALLLWIGSVLSPVLENILPSIIQEWGVCNLAQEVGTCRPEWHTPIPGTLQPAFYLPIHEENSDSRIGTEKVQDEPGNSLESTNVLKEEWGIITGCRHQLQGAPSGQMWHNVSIKK